MTGKKIGARKELKFRIGLIIVPIIGVSVAICSNPGIRKAVSKKLEAMKAKIRRKKMRAV